MFGAALKDAFRKVLGRKKETTSDSEIPDGRERRKSPRFRLHSGYVWYKVETRLSVIDVSVSGIAFQSAYPFETDQTIILSLDQSESIEAKVLASESLTAESIILEQTYRVRCQFADTAAGARFLARLHELDATEMGIAGKVSPPQL